FAIVSRIRSASLRAKDSPVRPSERAVVAMTSCAFSSPSAGAIKSSKSRILTRVIPRVERTVPLAGGAGAAAGCGGGAAGAPAAAALGGPPELGGPSPASPLGGPTKLDGPPARLAGPGADGSDGRRDCGPAGGGP